jgi:hypothetical protein
VSLTMTKQERETFLAELHVGIISIPEKGEDRSPCRSGTRTNLAASYGS